MHGPTEGFPCPAVRQMHVLSSGMTLSLPGRHALLSHMLAHAGVSQKHAAKQQETSMNYVMGIGSDCVNAGPSLIRTCTSPSCSSAYFKTSSWSACSSECDGGTSNRTVQYDLREPCSVPTPSCILVVSTCLANEQASCISFQLPSAKLQGWCLCGPHAHIFEGQALIPSCTR